MASVNHLDLFPFCIWPSKQAFIDEVFVPPITTVYEDFDNQIETITDDLNTIMALYWRVRKWRIFGSFDYYVTSKGSEDYSFIFTRDAATEADLVCTDEFGFVKQFTRTGNPISLPLSSGSAGFVAELALPFVGGNAPQSNRPVINQGNDLYSCGMRFFGGVEEGAPSADEYYAPVIVTALPKTSSPTGFDPPNATVLLSFLGKTYDLLALKVEPVLTLPTDPPTTTTLEISMEIEAVEYWGYDPNDGRGPIYDTSTGDRIRFDV
jgi:hypothetical protein